MTGDWKFSFLFVMLLEFAETFAHSLQYTDSNNTDVPMKTFTIVDYSDKVREGYTDSGSDIDPTDQPSLDTWSVIWYIVSFGGLILFFLVVSCSEWCCRRSARRHCQRNNTQTVPQVVLDTPPPSYEEFAPPSYEELWVGSSRGRSGEKSEYDVYVVPVHAFGTLMEGAPKDDAPPSYQSASALSHINELPQVHTTSRIT